MMTKTTLKLVVLAILDAHVFSLEASTHTHHAVTNRKRPIDISCCPAHGDQTSGIYEKPNRLPNPTAFGRLYLTSRNHYQRSSTVWPLWKSVVNANVVRLEMDETNRQVRR